MGDIKMEETKSIQRIYSNDKKIWVGMKLTDANKSPDDIRIFNFADKNRNGEISKEELDRYNGPILAEDISKNKGRMINYKSPKAIELRKNEIDYYPGLKFEQVNQRGRVIYGAIDSNHENILSKNELIQVNNVRAKMSKTKKKIHDMKSIRDTSMVVGMIAGSLTYIITLAAYYENIGLMSCMRKKILGTIMARGTLAAVASLIGGLSVGAVCNYLTKKERKKLQKEVDHPYLKEHINEIKN